MCKAGSMPLYVASDSRAAILLFDHLCPGRIVHQYYDWSGSGAAGAGGGSLLLEDSSTKHGMHSEVLRSRPHLDPAITTSSSSGNSSSGGGGGSGLLLDWLMLGSAHAVTRWGAQHSSFAGSASLRGCSERMWRSPKSWKYKAATSWLLGKLRFHGNKVKLNASYDCAATISPMLRTIGPCTSGCVRECLGYVHRAFA